MKELEISQTFIKFDPKPPADAKPGETSPDKKAVGVSLPQEPVGEDEPKATQPTTVEIVDMTLDVVLGRRHEHVMNRTLRIRTALTKDDHTHSNSHRITF